MRKKLQKQLQIFFKMGVLKNFANFTTGKYLCWSLFLIKLQAWRPAGMKTCNFIIKKLQHRCFPVKFAKFLRTSFLQNTSDGYFLNSTYASASVLLHIRIGNLDWNESHEKQTKYIHASAADLLHIRMGNQNCKKEAIRIREN